MTDTEKDIIRSASQDTSMYVLQITNKDDSLILRGNAKDINHQTITSDEDLQLLIARMKATLIKEQGVGLAAPQVGISRNIFLFMRIDQPESYPVHVAINPKIVDHSQNTIPFHGDGCLSIPDKSGTSIRYPWIEVEYYNEKGELIREQLTGRSREEDFTGIIFQHEFDHLQGVLFTDKLQEEELSDN